MEITAIDATLGAVITDVDLATLDDGTWAQIHSAFLEYGLLAFPDQHLDEELDGVDHEHVDDQGGHQQQFVPGGEHACL